MLVERKLSRSCSQWDWNEEASEARRGRAGAGAGVGEVAGTLQPGTGEKIFA